MFGQNERPKPPKRSIKSRGNKTNYEHVGKEPGTDYKYRYQMYLMRKNEGIVAEGERLAEENIKEFNVHDFINQTANRTIIYNINNLISSAKETMKLELDAKRNRLRNFLSDEDNRYQMEFTRSINQRKIQNRCIQHQRLLQMEKEKERKRLELVEEKRIQQLINNSSEDAAPVFSKQILMDSKLCQLQQMDDHKVFKEMEKTTNNFWHRMILKIVDQMMRKEENERERIRVKNKNAQNILIKQMGDKELRKNSKKDDFEEAKLKNQRIAEELKEEARKAFVSKIDSQQKVAADLHYQITSAEKIRREEAANDRRIYNLYLDTIKDEILKESAQKLTENDKRKRETITYLEFLKGMQTESKFIESQKQKIFIEFRKQIEEKNYEEIVKRDEIHKQIEIDAYGEMKNQIKQNELRKSDTSVERMKSAIEIQKLVDDANEFEMKESQKKHKCNIEYGKELLVQAEHQRNKKNEEIHMRNLEIMRNKEMQKESIDLVNQLLLHPEKIKLASHPMKKVLQGKPCQLIGK